MSRAASRTPLGAGWWSATVSLVGLGIAAAVLSPLALGLQGMEGARSLLLAAAACAAGSVVGVLVGSWFHAPGQVLPRVLIGMVSRLAGPSALLLGGWLLELDWTDVGLAIWLVVFYSVGLALDTVELCRVVNAGPSRRAIGSPPGNAAPASGNAPNGSGPK